jgi:GR25 family glycosyltransferase involved in LPS biosynthesis
MHLINFFFDAVFCLNLDRRPDRKQQAINEFNEFGIQVEFISGIDGSELPDTHTTSSDSMPVSKGDMGCTLSHLKMIQLAKERGYKNVMIFEDDVEFPSVFNSIIGMHLFKLPSDWDMFYFGGNHAGGFEMVNEKIAKVKKTYTTHAYAVRNTVFDEMIRVLSEVEKVDISISSLHSKFNCYVCRPHVAFQRDGFSDILERKTTYPFLRD